MSSGQVFAHSLSVALDSARAYRWSARVLDMAGSSELLNVLGDVKARVQDKLGIVDFPMPQFILIGKQSVGKSRLIESMAGRTFNFISGTLGSRRPTVLEFRNLPSRTESQWYVRDRATNQWGKQPIEQVMKIVGQAHEELGESVSSDPVYVRIESAECVDMQIVDLPGFRDFAMDSGKQALGSKIEELVMTFMRDKNNVMLCVEQAGDASTMATLAKCREVDPKFERTILIRNKLDKYYSDLTVDNVNKWVLGYGDLPEHLVTFSLTLPWWPDGSAMPDTFSAIRKEKSDEDVRQMASKSISAKFAKTIGFDNFAKFMERKIESMFSDALNPVLTNLKDLRKEHTQSSESLQVEYGDTKPERILSTTRDCGVSFATALIHVMEGVLDLKPVQNLEDELQDFHAYHRALGSTHFSMLPSEDFSGLADYINYLRNEIMLAAFEVEVNGGAQYQRLMNEVEIFLRFSEIAVECKKKDVIQARGVSLTSLSWRDVVVKLLNNEAHLPLLRRVTYVGERIKWFFESQKEAVLSFMINLEDTPRANLFSPLYPKHGKLMKQNEMIKHLVFHTYDSTCKRQLQMFVELFENVLTSTFSNPWVFLKGSTGSADAEGDLGDCMLPAWEDTKKRIVDESTYRNGAETTVTKWIEKIPTDSAQIDEAVDQVQIVVFKTYQFVRSQICDEVELFAESFFKLPMLRRLEEDMSTIDLSPEDKAKYQARRDRLGSEIKQHEDDLLEINWCINRLQDFRIQSESKFSSNQA